jgi:quinol monooxygenase YgiN
VIAPGGGAEGRVIIVAIHPVKDYDVWKQAIERWSARWTHERGFVRYWIHRSVDDPNEVMVAIEVRDQAAAERLMKDARGTMQAWLDEAELDVYPPLFVGQLVAETHVAP